MLLSVERKKNEPKKSLRDSTQSSSLHWAVMSKFGYIQCNEENSKLTRVLLKSNVNKKVPKCKKVLQPALGCAITQSWSKYTTKKENQII